jgi:hypothetical protein
MASIDVSADYKKLQGEVESTKAYKDLKKQYDKAAKKYGSSFEKLNENISQRIDSISGKTKAYQKQVKTQFDELLNINDVTGSNSIKYINWDLY